MKIRMAFGRTGLEITLPDGPQYRVLRAHSAAGLPNVQQALEDALDRPIGSPALLELASGKKTAAISVCDITRPAPNSTTLPPMLERLHRAGIPREGVTLMIATGLHRPATAEEVQVILGAEIAANYRVVNHDAKVESDHRYLGTTQRGTPVSIDSRFLDADLHLTLGFIEQHLMLGFSGGRKLIAPGLAAQATIKTIHSPRFMREPLATEGSIEANPLHAELLEVARMARHDFMLDVTLTQDRQISGIFAGDAVQAHAAGVAFLRESALERLSHAVDAVITSAAGYPLDLTLYQTIKGVTAVQHILKPGGKILILSECAEGIGSPEFAAKVKAYPGAVEFLEQIRNTPVVVDQWQLEKLALVSRKHTVLFYAPHLDPADLGDLATSHFTDLEKALAELVRDLDDDAQVAVVPDGPYTYAMVDEASPQS